MKQKHIFSITSIVLTMIFCQQFIVPHFASAAEKSSPLSIAVSILPQEYFIKRIGGERVEISTLVQPGHSPHTYAPTPKQMAVIASAKIFFRIGVPFEKSLIPKLERSVPDLAIIDLQQGIELITMDDGHDDEHHEEKENDHEHDHQGDVDPHTWLDPKLALAQSVLIRDTLIRFDPQGETIYNKNFSALAQDLEDLDTKLRSLLLPLAEKTIYVFHPAYGYFCKAYGLKQKAVQPEGKDPGARYLARLIEQARNENVKVIFVQPQFSQKAARTIAQSIGGSVIALDPLARDYLANMRAMTDQLVQSFAVKEQ